MIVAGYGAIFLISTLIFKHQFGKVLNFAFIFNAIWCIFGMLSMLGFYDLIIPRFTVHLYVYFFVITVDICIALFASRSKQAIAQEATTQNSVYSRGIPIVKIIQIFSLILIFSLFSKSVLSFMTTGDFSVIRGLYFGNNFDSFYLDFLLRTFPVAMMEGLIIYYVYKAFLLKKLKYIQYAALNCIIITLCSGGRYTLLLFLFSIVICMISFKIDRKNLQAWKKYIWKILPFIILLAASFVVVTIFRNQMFTRNIILYYSGSLSLLDYILGHEYMFALHEKLYGYLTFSTLLEPFVLIFKTIGLTDIKVPDYYFDMYCQDYYNVATSGVLYMNNNTSVIYYFLRDFGVAGIFVGGLFLSSLVITAYNRWRKTSSMFAGLVFIYFCNVLFNSLMTYQFFGRSPLILLATLYLCSRRKHPDNPVDTTWNNPLASTPCQDLSKRMPRDL